MSAPATETSLYAHTEKAKPQRNKKPLVIAGVLALLGAIAVGVGVGVYFATKDTSPPSPPPAPPGTAAVYLVSTSFTASGDVADYTPAKIDSIAAVVASESGANADDVEVSVAPGSVEITVSITVASAEAAETTATSLGGDDGMFSSANALEMALTDGGVSGVTVAAISKPPEAAVAYVYSPSPPMPVSPAAAPDAAFSVLGHWKTDWDEYVTITATAWISVSAYGVTSYDLVSFGAAYALMQNAADAAYSASKWSKVQFHATGAAIADGFAYCFSVYDAETMNAALAINTYDVYNASENGKGGCGQFAPTVASPYTMPIAGTYLDNWGAYVTVNDHAWYSYGSVESILLYTNAIFLKQTPADSEYNPLKWSKVEFHTVGNGFAHCSSAYGADTAEAALKTDTSNVYNKSETGSGGCGQFAHSVASPYSIPIAGTYLDNWGTYVTVTNDAWYSGGSVDRIEMYTNALFLKQSPPTDNWNPNKYSKVEFHTVGNGFAHCSSVYGADTAETALKTDTSNVYNKSETGNGGCSQFSHTVASPFNIPITGDWIDNWGTVIAVTNKLWNARPIEVYGANFLVYQNAADASWNPSKWVKIEFHAVDGGFSAGFGYCQSVMDAPTAEAAYTQDTSASGTGKYDATNAETGCGGQFSHSIASPAGTP